VDICSRLQKTFVRVLASADLRRVNENSPGALRLALLRKKKLGVTEDLAGAFL
jgi:hypothetical protein